MQIVALRDLGDATPAQQPDSGRRSATHLTFQRTKEASFLTACNYPM